VIVLDDQVAQRRRKT